MNIKPHKTYTLQYFSYILVDKINNKWEHVLETVCYHYQEEQVNVSEDNKIIPT